MKNKGLFFFFGWLYGWKIFQAGQTECETLMHVYASHETLKPSQKIMTKLFYVYHLNIELQIRAKTYQLREKAVTRTKIHILIYDRPIYIICLIVYIHSCETSWMFELAGLNRWCHDKYDQNIYKLCHLNKKSRSID